MWNDRRKGGSQPAPGRGRGEVLEGAARRRGFSADIELRGDKYFLLNSGPRPVCLGASLENAKAALVRMAEAGQGTG